MNDTDNNRSTNLSWSVIGRALEAVLVIGAALFIGSYIGTLLKERFPSIHDGSIVLGLTLVISTMRDAVPQLQALGEFIWKGKTSPGGALYGFAAFVCISAATFLAATVATGNQPINVGPFVFFQQSPTASGSTQPSATSKSVDNTESFEPITVSVPFLNEPDACDPPFGAGTELNSGTETLINNLATGLLHCAEPSKPVTVEIQGFASSQNFKEKCKKGNEGVDDKKLNKDLGEARASKVATNLKKAIESEKQERKELSGRTVTINNPPWPDWGAMNAKAKLNDQERIGKKVHSDFDRGDFTRRVDIVINDAGDCKVLSAGAVRQTF